MPHSSYTVASADKLGGTAKIPRIKKAVQFTLEITQVHDGPLRRESRSILDRTETCDNTLTAAQQDHTPTEIYFAPVLANSSTALLSHPKEAPTPLTLDKLTITVDQLNQLVSALAHTPLIRDSLQGHNLTFDRIDKRTSDKSAALYTLPNKQFSNRTAQQIAPDLHLINGDAGGVVVIDAKVPGNPVRCTSAVAAADSTAVGDSTYVALPYGLAAAARLDTSGGEVKLQVVHTVISRKDGERACFVSTEEDVTESLTRAAIAELAHVTYVPVNAIELGETAAGSFIDLSAILDDLQATSKVADIIGDIIYHIRHMDAETCSMQTLTLMAELSRIKACNRDFLILRPGSSVNGQVTGASCPFLSQSFYDSLSAELSHVGNAQYALQEFLRSIVQSVYPCAVADKEFCIRNGSSTGGFLRCVPLFESVIQPPKAWAIFVESSVRDALLYAAVAQAGEI